MQQQVSKQDEGLLSPSISMEDEARVRFYSLIAHLFVSAPPPALLAALAAADPLPTLQLGNQLEQAWENLTAAAGLIPPEVIQEEFDALFVGVGNPRINPHASLYLSGFLMEKPLAALRDDMAQLGLERQAGRLETEDHLSGLCEAMRLLISGEQGVVRQPEAQQRIFFEKHMVSWCGRCMEDIRQVEQANFYRCVADFTQAFIEMEQAAFDMVEGNEENEKNRSGISAQKEC